MFFEQWQTRHMILTWKRKHGSQLPFSNLIVLFGLKGKKKWEIWPSRVNRAGRATGSVVSIAHWQGLIRCHTHTVSSWETAGLTEPFDTKIWKGLTNYWGKGWLGGGGCHSSSLELPDAQMLFLTLDVDRLHEVTDISSVYYGTNCDFINNLPVSQISLSQFAFRWDSVQTNRAQCLANMAKQEKNTQKVLTPRTQSLEMLRWGL